MKVVNGVAVKIEGDSAHPHNLGKLCAKGGSGLNYLYNPWRVKVPLRRTNPKKGMGIDPQWIEITWDEAIDEIAEKVKKAREKDPRLVLINTYDRTHEFGIIIPIVDGLGTPNFLGGGASYTCGPAYHPISYLCYGSWYFEPDLDLCKYLLMVGTSTGFLSGYSAMPTTMEMADARRKGMKIVVVDPICTSAGAKADEWIPIRPGTDGAFALGLLNVILNELGRYDAEFLRRFTNAPYLVGQNGKYLRDRSTGEPLVWNNSEGRPVSYDKCRPDATAIEGEFDVDGVRASPAFLTIKRHIAKYTPEKVSEITTVSAGTIRRIAQEFSTAANLGGSISIDGKTLPYRPVAAIFERGTSGHKHGFMFNWSVQLLNLVMGSLDVPGGVLGLNARGPWWEPTVGRDGFLKSSKVSAAYYMPYPPRKAKRPESLEAIELFPVACFSQAIIPLATISPERFGLDYVPEVMLHCRSNYLVTTADPEVLSEFARKIPFVVSFQSRMEESAELADIILPDTVYLERAPMPINTSFVGTRVGMSSWYWGFMQPVVDPPPGVRDWTLVLLEIAKRAGCLRDIYKVLNDTRLKEPYKLDLDKEYAWDEIVDRWLKSYAGQERGLSYMKEHGFIEFAKKKVEETYWRYFKDIRVPVYLEHFIEAAEDVEDVTRKIGIKWDTSDYQTVPDWKPCPAIAKSPQGFDLYIVNYKTPHNTLSHTSVNPWIDAINEANRTFDIVMNTETGRRKGIRDGDYITIETSDNRKASGTVKLVESIHPDAIGISGGFGRKAEGPGKGKGILWNWLVPYDIEHMDSVAGGLDMCMKAKITKESTPLQIEPSAVR